MNIIKSLCNEIKKLHQVDVVTRHTVHGGIYEREIDLPANTILTGKVHLTDHIAKLVSGTMIIFGQSVDGWLIDPKEYKAPHTFKGEKGIARIGLTVTDCTFANYHYVGDLENIDEIEKLLVIDTDENYLDYTAEGITWHLLDQLPQ